MPGKETLLLALVGDSDIEYWPKELLPCVQGICEENHSVVVRGQSGATLNETIPLLRTVLEEYSSSQQPQGRRQRRIILVACAGENDIGNGMVLDSTLSALHEFLNMVHAFVTAECSSTKPQEQQVTNGTVSHHVIFLGPKFEPWLEEDLSYKKKYSKMSRAFQRCCDKHCMNEQYENLHYVDCLTMFYGDSATVPGAVLGGKAKAEFKYFEGDRLHLSTAGYQIWKQVVEQVIETQILNPTKRKQTTS
jgi:lysophospholipase L1-like esterase